VTKLTNQSGLLVYLFQANRRYEERAGMTGGPHIQIAAICEKALQEADGVLSLVRIIDRFFVTAQGTGYS
jgi:hypothetical protein